MGRLPTFTLRLVLSGSILSATTLVLALTQPLLGTPRFFLLAGVAAACQVVMLAAIRHAPPGRRLVMVAFAFAVLCRLPLALGPVEYDSDMVRYIYDGRVQRLGYNPYAIVPSDPAIAGDPHRRDRAHAEPARPHAVSARRAAVLPRGRDGARNRRAR